MAVQAIGGVSSPAAVAPTRAAAPAGTAARSADSTVVVSRITRTNPDGSTTTTVTYADGHTETETTPAKPGSAQASSAAGEDGQGRVTSVNLLA